MPLPYSGQPAAGDRARALMGAAGLGPMTLQGPPPRVQRRDSREEGDMGAPVDPRDPKFLRLSLDASPEYGIERVGGRANIRLDDSQRIGLNGYYEPGYQDPMGVSVQQGYGITGTYETPGVQFDVNYRPTRRGMGGMPGGDGWSGQVKGGVRW